MTENEIKEATFEDALYCAKTLVGLEMCEECRFNKLCHVWCDDVYRIILDALEEIQQYRAIGTVEELQKQKDHLLMVKGMCKDYYAIGTIDEFKALKEKSVAKKSTEFHENEVCLDFICPNCKEAVYGQPYKPNYCKHCGQKLDWSE